MKRQGLLSLTGILLLVLLALLTMHEWERVVPSATPAGTGTPPPSLQLSGVSARSFGEQGELAFQLDASAMEWLEQKGMSAVQQPRLLLPLEEGEWQIESEQGTMAERKGRITLTGNVIARRQGNLPMQLETQTLHYLTASERVSAPGAVLISSDQGRISAGAMEADLVAQILELRNGVETRYEPAP